MKVPKCDLKDAKTLMTLDVDASSCSKNCFETSACKSFVSRTISPSCILYEDDSTEKMLIDVLHTDFYQLRRSVPTEYRDELWNDFKQSNTLEKINSVGCGIRVYDSYNFVNKKEISDSIAYSTFSFKQNPYHNLITEAQMNAHSVLDCSRLFEYLKYFIKVQHCDLKDGKCPVDFVYNGYLPSNNDLGITYTQNYTQCFKKCEAEPKCQSFEYSLDTTECRTSAANHTTMNLKFWGSELYADIDKIKEVSNLTAYSTFSFKQNPYHNLITEAQMDAHSVLDCSHLCTAAVRSIQTRNP
ncbi:Hypothetical predicted protein [Octopus vulgaris]|uniref:Apple domain-containing protein n=1 Tax=Octopus vulgaris TaxID=6645 RepID=A0AA36FDP1_OCTVU|nr:Hypothetical predicted protein [Octopus vulgaris]